MVIIAVKTDDLYELQQAADTIGVGIATLYRWMKDGRITPLRIGNRTYIPASEIQRLAIPSCFNCYHIKTDQSCSCREPSDMKPGCPDWRLKKG